MDRLVIAANSRRQRSVIAFCALSAALLLVFVEPQAGGAPVATPATRSAVPFKAFVDLPTFMEHVLTPAADRIWLATGTIIDASGEHDLTPKTNEQWDEVVTGAATLAEATNALLIPDRARGPSWVEFSRRLAVAAEEAYRAAEAHDIDGVRRVSERLDGICADCHRQYGVE